MWRLNPQDLVAKGSRVRCRASRIGGALALGVAAGLALPTLPARSTPGCSTALPAAPVVAEAPWSQQRFAPDRLTGLADGHGVLVAVIDSGVDAGHPQLTGAVVTGFDLLDPGQDGRLDCVGHGTAVASIIAARPGPGIAFRGLAPAATILPVRVSERAELDQGTTGRTTSPAGIGTAVRQATDRGARVINLSLTSDRDDPAFREAIRYALTHDVVIVAAAGNRHDSGDPTPYPAAYDDVIGVGAIQADGTRLPASQTGPYVDLVAPGAGVLAAARGRGHGVYTGTSFAVPYVSATAALVRQYWPTLTAAAVRERLLATADPAQGGPGSTEYGAGVVNPYRAVTARIDASRRPVQAAPAPLGDSATGVPATAARTRTLAYTIAEAGGTLAVLVAFAAAAMRRGTRRRWRAG